MIKGIDLSHWQGNVIFSKLFDKTDNSSFDFIILKLSQYQTKDSKFEQYYASAKDKYKVGCYIYNKARSIAQAKVEAEFAVNELKGREMSAWVWLDMEDNSLVNLGKNVLTQIIDTEANILKKAGYKVGIYCNPNWYKNILNSKNLAKRYKFWIARYPESDNGTLKESISPKSYASIWQYSSKGKVNGISGNVDMNILYEDIFSNSNTGSTTSIISSSSNSQASDVSEYIKVGQFHSINFTGYTIPITGKFDNDTKKQAARVLQQAINLDYKAGLVVDGNFGTKSKNEVSKHLIKKGDILYSVNAIIILLLLKGYNINFNSIPTLYDDNLECLVKKFQKDNYLVVDGIVGLKTWSKLM